MYVAFLLIVSFAPFSSLAPHTPSHSQTVPRGGISKHAITPLPPPPPLSSHPQYDWTVDWISQRKPHFPRPRLITCCVYTMKVRLTWSGPPYALGVQNFFMDWQMLQSCHNPLLQQMCAAYQPQKLVTWMEYDLNPLPCASMSFPLTLLPCPGPARMCKGAP